MHEDQKWDSERRNVYEMNNNVCGRLCRSGCSSHLQSSPIVRVVVSASWERTGGALCMRGEAVTTEGRKGMVMATHQIHKIRIQGSIVLELYP
jgi:hypothetical protein